MKTIRSSVLTGALAITLACATPTAFARDEPVVPSQSLSPDNPLSAEPELPAEPFIYYSFSSDDYDVEFADIIEDSVDAGITSESDAAEIVYGLIEADSNGMDVALPGNQTTPDSVELKETAAELESDGSPQAGAHESRLPVRGTG